MQLSTSRFPLMTTCPPTLPRPSTAIGDVPKAPYSCNLQSGHLVSDDTLEVSSAQNGLCPYSAQDCRRAQRHMMECWCSAYGECVCGPDDAHESKRFVEFNNSYLIFCGPHIYRFVLLYKGQSNGINGLSAEILHIQFLEWFSTHRI